MLCAQLLCHLSVQFCVVSVLCLFGGKESVIVIWKADKPRCFKSIDVAKLPVKYFCEINAWMTRETLDEVAR